MLFDVRLVAFDDAADGDPADALVRVFGLDQRAARELLRRLPHVVKRGVSEESAHKLVGALDRIGAQTEIVVSTRGAREPTGQRTPAANADTTARLGALPAPAPAASAMIDARAAREQAARMEAARARQPQPAPARGGAASQAALAANAPRMLSRESLPTLPDDDSLEADIGTPSQAPEAMLERATLVAAPRVVPAHMPPLTAAPHMSMPQPAAAALRKPAPAPQPQPTPQARRGVAPQPNAQAARAAPSQAAAHAPRAAAAPMAVEAARLSLPQPAQAVQTGFRVALPKLADGFAAEAPLFVPAHAAVPQATAAANAQRPIAAAAPPAASLPRVSLPGAAQRPALPTLSIHGPPVEASACIMPGTKGMVVFAWLGAATLTVSLTVLSLGVLAVVGVVAATVGLLSRRRQLAALRASALPVGQSQLPELYACAKQFALRLGLERVPRLYIVAGAPHGLRAMTDGRDLVLVLDETSLLRFLEGPRPEALSCLIAHELARHALGYNTWTRGMLSRVSPRLACLDLLTADSVATALVLDHGIVKAALLSLLGAGRLQAYLDNDELDRVATSTMREPGLWPTRFGAHDGFVLARLYHLQRGYV